MITQITYNDCIMSPLQRREKLFYPKFIFLLFFFRLFLYNLFRGRTFRKPSYFECQCDLELNCYGQIKVFISDMGQNTLS